MLGLVVGHGDAELVFQGKDDLDAIERVHVKVLQGCVQRNLVARHGALLRNDVHHCLFNIDHDSDLP